MNYEKAYKEALERARQIKDGKDEWRYSDLAEITPALTEIFPELRESEDERIRKEIINYLDFAESHNLLRAADYKKKKGWIEWLKKQQEQKRPDGCFTCNEYKKGYEAGRLNGITAGYNKAMKEQNPAWSEEDEDMLNCCISSIEEAKENRYAYKETDGDTSYDREIAFLKSLRPSWKPSEEQIYSLGTVVNGIGEASVGSIGYNLKELYWHLKKLI